MGRLVLSNFEKYLRRLDKDQLKNCDNSCMWKKF